MSSERTIETVQGLALLFGFLVVVVVVAVWLGYIILCLALGPPGRGR